MNRMEKYLNSRAGKQFFKEIYRPSDSEKQRDRYLLLFERFVKEFKSEECLMINVPGRVEISGNHTDHNRGMVIAGSITLDAVTLCRPAENMKATIHDLKYNEVLTVDLSSPERREDEFEKPESLIRGVAAGLKAQGFEVGGFDAVLHNEVMSGSGLSSSAVFEIAIGSVLNALYNNLKIESVELARIAQYAENEYFGKPCGLMDQIACAAGGMVFIDFKNVSSPMVSSLPVNFSETRYSLIIVKTGANHAGLTEHYAAIPQEMKQAASVFNKEALRDVEFYDLIARFGEIRKKYGDRAFLRAVHFFGENRRVEEQVEALKKSDLSKFLLLVNESGTSSWKYLQNVIIEDSSRNQEMAVTLAVTDFFIKQKKRGAVRVHGGGFAGTILCFINKKDAEEYLEMIQKITGEGSASILDIRNTGAAAVEL